MALAEEIEESTLSPEERAYLQARRAAEQKLDLYLELAKKAVIVLLLLVFITPVGVILGLIWGYKFGRRYFRMLVEPGLRERFLEEEVRKQVQVGVHEQRRELGGEHARSLQELSASIAHEIRNPITAAKSLVQQMGEEPGSNDNVEYARVALAELDRVERSISHLLRFGRDEEIRKTEVHMGDVLDSAIETFRDRVARSDVEILRQFDCDGLLQGDPEKLRRVAINLIGNAMDALEEAQVEKPCIEVSMGENLAGSEVWVRIRDNGPGIDETSRQKMFSPFYTSKEGGTGLGLAITKKVVEAHRGTIEVLSEPGRGAEFVVTFPKESGREGGAS